MWEELYLCGGFNFQVVNYVDYFVDEKVNRMFYDFWCKKIWERVRDFVKVDIVVLFELFYLFVIKCSSLEYDYYECISCENVDLVDFKKFVILEFMFMGIKIEDGDE